MKQNPKTDVDLLGLVGKIQAQLIAVEMKIDTLIGRAMGDVKPAAKPQANNGNNKERVMYKAICADCQKECSIPFKPSGDRPVYCQDCFSRRKVMRLSGMKIEEKPQVQAASVVAEPAAAAPKNAAKKKKAAAAKKAPAKKKAAPKKK